MVQNGTTFQQFKKELLQHLQTVCAVQQSANCNTEIIGHDSSEIFGSPRQLEIIYPTNMQWTYCVVQYQAYMTNIDSNPLLGNTTP